MVTRQWRTRHDPFARVTAEIGAMRGELPSRSATSVLAELQNRYPGQFIDSQVRTLQRRFATQHITADDPKSQHIWLLRILRGNVRRVESGTLLGRGVSEAEIRLLLRCQHHRAERVRRIAAAVLGGLHGIPKSAISFVLQIDRQTVSNYWARYAARGYESVVDFGRSTIKKTARMDYREALFSILHEPPSLYGINRTRWEMKHLKQVMTQRGFPIALSNIRRIIRGSGYRFRRARMVLTSTDPEYRAKLQRITAILSHLQPNERFFSVDEFGPFRVRMTGGRMLIPPDEIRAIPQWQKSKGKLLLTGALELSSNQVTHFYSESKNTTEMIKLLKLLRRQYASAATLYFSWDAASWHASKRLREYVDRANSSPLRKHPAPKVELVPLPTRAQFLNVIESVFSGMARAVLHNSDYPSVEDCMIAIDRHFAERNAHFAECPERAGKKLWGDERVPPAFGVSNNCKSPHWR